MEHPSPDRAGPAAAGGHPLRSIVGGSLGNLVEWYDWYVYAAFTLYFAPVFFPGTDATAQLLSAAAIFAVGFVMRPLGAWAMGIYADRHGRKAGLALSVLLMGGGSVGIACIPPHSAIGTLAPLLLLVARSIQGLSIGGEYGASATYLTEMAAAERRGFYSSFQYVTLIAGQLIALCVLLVLQAALPPSDLERWGWRIPFLLGGALAVGVYLVRRRLDETAAFQKAVRSGAGRSGGLALFRHHPRAVAQVIGLTAGGTLAFYAYSTYMQKFLVNTAGFARETATAIMAGALFIYMLVQPLAGALSDRVGRRPLLLGFGVVGMLATVPIFSALERAPSAGAAFFLVLAGLILTTGYTAINAVVKAELFPAHIRALGVALPYALANTLFGGTAEYVALWLKQAGIERSFYYYVSAMIAVSLIVVLRMADTRHANRMAE